MNSISKKVLACFLPVLLVAVLATVVLFNVASNVKQQANQYVDSTLPELDALQSIQQTTDEIEIAAYALYGTTLKAGQFKQKLTNAEQQLKHYLAADGNLSGYDSREKTLTQTDRFLASIKKLQSTMTSRKIDWDQARRDLAEIDKQSASLSENVKQIKSMVNIDAKNTSDSINAGLSSILLYVLALLVSIVVVAVVSYFITNKTITEPIRNLSGELDLVATNFDLTVRVPEKSKDEIGNTSQSINRLIYAFNDGLKNVSNAAVDVSSLVSNLSQSSEHADKQVELLNQKIDYLVNQMNSLEQQIEQGFERSHLASDTAKRGAEEVQQGAEEVSKTSDGIASLARDIEASSEMLMELKTSGSQVSTVVSTIAEIAEQTNLLALNAAIEAARAGESGRGFAVVADEVRTLANRTHQSTIEINTMLEKIVDSISQVVSSMEVNESKASSAVELAEKTVDSLSQIKSTILSLSSENQEVATLADNSRNQVIAIRENVDQFKSVGEAVHNGSVETRSSSNMMSEVANRLSQSVSRFKI